MCKETEFVEKATKIIFNGCRESMARVKEGDTIVIDEKYKHDYGDFHKWRAGDEFRVTRVEQTPFIKSVYCVATKAPSDGGHTVRGEVGAKTEFHDKMPLFDYLRIKGDLTVRNNLRQLCRDYLEGTTTTLEVLIEQFKEKYKILQEVKVPDEPITIRDREGFHASGENGYLSRLRINKDGRLEYYHDWWQYGWFDDDKYIHQKIEALKQVLK